MILKENETYFLSDSFLGDLEEIEDVKKTQKNSFLLLEKSENIFVDEIYYILASEKPLEALNSFLERYKIFDLKEEIASIVYQINPSWIYFINKEKELDYIKPRKSCVLSFLSNKFYKSHYKANDEDGLSDFHFSDFLKTWNVIEKKSFDKKLFYDFFKGDLQKKKGEKVFFDYNSYKIYGTPVKRCFYSEKENKIIYKAGFSNNKEIPLVEELIPKKNTLDLIDVVFDEGLKKCLEETSLVSISWPIWWGRCSKIQQKISNYLFSIELLLRKTTGYKKNLLGLNNRLRFNLLSLTNGDGGFANRIGDEYFICVNLYNRNEEDVDDFLKSRNKNICFLIELHEWFHCFDYFCSGFFKPRLNGRFFTDISSYNKKSLNHKKGKSFNRLIGRIKKINYSSCYKYYRSFPVIMSKKDWYLGGDKFNKNDLMNVFLLSYETCGWNLNEDSEIILFATEKFIDLYYLSKFQNKKIFIKGFKEILLEMNSQNFNNKYRLDSAAEILARVFEGIVCLKKNMDLKGYIYFTDKNFFTESALKEKSKLMKKFFHQLKKNYKKELSCFNI